MPAAEKKEKPPGKRKKSKNSEDGEYDSGPGQDQELPADKKRLPEKETSKPENAPKEESVPEEPTEVKTVLTKEPEKEEDVKSGQIGSSAERPGPLEKIKRLYNKVKTAVLKIYGILVHIPEFSLYFPGMKMFPQETDLVFTEHKDRLCAFVFPYTDIMLCLFSDSFCFVLDSLPFFQQFTGNIRNMDKYTKKNKK